MLVEHIQMLTERSKFSIVIVLATYAACGNQPGRGDCRKGGRGDSGGRSGGAGMRNGERDKRVISNGYHDFAVHKLNSIDNFWYPDPEYQNMNPQEKRKLYLY